MPQFSQLFQHFRRHHSVECDAFINIIALERLPLLKGKYLVDWRLVGGGSSTALLNTNLQTHGRTSRVPLTNYTATWDTKIHTHIRLAVGDNSELLPCRCIFTIHQLVEKEKPSIVGRVTVNLAEYVQPPKFKSTSLQTSMDALNLGSSHPRKYRLENCYFPRAALRLELRLEPRLNANSIDFKVPALDRTLVLEDEWDWMESVMKERDERRKIQNTRKKNTLESSLTDHRKKPSMQQVEVLPGDIFQYHIQALQGSTLQWWFSTKRKNISFGLYKLGPPKSSSHSLASTTSRRNSRIINGLQALNINSSAASTANHSVTTEEDDANGVSQEKREQGRPKKSIAPAKLANADLVEVLPILHYESAVNTIKGQYEVDEDGTYVLCFDNTFSINTTKTLTFYVNISEEPVTKENSKVELSGWLLKKKRKMMQGWAKRWFELDHGVLSYRLQPLGVVRGTLQVSLCSISESPKEHAITIDSGTIVYQMRAYTAEDYETWVEALRACQRGEEISALVGGDERKNSLLGNQWLPFARVRDRELKSQMANVEDVLKRLGPLMDTAASHAPDIAEQIYSMYSELVAASATMHASVRIELSRWRQLEMALRRGFAGNGGLFGLLANPAAAASVISVLSTASAEVFFDAREDYESESEDEGAIPGDQNIASTNSASVDENGSAVVPAEPPVVDRSSLASTLFAPAPIKRRERLPHPICGEEVSLLSILRKNVGKDLSTVAMPVSLNEPLNALQRLCEELEYSELLDAAAALTDSMERLARVTAFAVSGYASTKYRAYRKPFNPMHGETFECVREDKGFRYISEKVSHRPPIMACHAESANFIFFQDSKLKSKFWGKSMELQPSGVVNVLLPKYRDHFTYNKPSTWTRNLIAGTRYLEHTGTVRVENRATGEYCELTFREADFWGQNRDAVDGVLYDRTGKKWGELSGKWSEGIVLVSSAGGGDGTEIWRAHTPLPDVERYYGFTKFAMELNEITPELSGKLPGTDTRHRPDQRLFEFGKVQEADAEKLRVEQKQRMLRQRMEEEGRTWEPQWFELKKDPFNNEDEGSWHYKGGYWEARETGAFGKAIELW
ncbi:uncharacterized protein VTP21DRAFT_10568 [Calcarisporiella thermophila]|uniref:uncharacterized protein n=1 Tax=Calcarisporiella thermophila TaxID=911321 RepID=UPI00374397D8